MRFGLIASAHVVASAAVFSDNFNRADSNPTGAGGGVTPGAGLGAAWLGASWGVTTNQAVRFGNTSGDDFAVFLNDCSPDHWVEATIVIGPASSVYTVINTRRPSNNANTGYMGFIAPGGTATIGRIVSGTYADVATASASNANGQKLRLESQGSALRLYIANSLVVSTTDTNISGANHYTGLNAVAGGIVDDFRCGPLPWTP